MAVHRGRGGIVKFDTNTAAEAKDWSIDVSTDTLETTDLTTTGYRDYIGGLYSWSGSVNIMFDESDAGQGSIETKVLSGASATLNLKWSEDDSAAADVGSVIFTGFNITSSFDGLVEASVSFQGTGAITLPA